MTTAGAAALRGADTEGRKDAPGATRTRRRWEAADSVVAGSTLLVAAIVGIFILLCVQGYNSALENARKRALTAANIVAEETHWVFATAKASLDFLATRLDGDPAATPDALADFEAAATTIPMDMRVGIYDASGTLTESGPATSPLRDSIAGNDFFQSVAGGERWAISAQEKNPETGAATFAVARRLDGLGGFEGAAVLIIEADVLRRLGESQELGTGSTISVVRTDGWIIARSLPLPAPMNISGTANYERLMEAESGSYISASSPADGVARIVGFRRVDEHGYIAVASLSKEVVLSGLWTSIWIVSLLLAPIAVALLVGSFVTAGLLRRSEATSRSLAAALEHNETLFREIHHRLKNNLQSVNSLLQLHAIPREVRADMSQRIAAMSAVHEHIYRSNTFSQVRVKDYLHTLIANIRAGQDPRVQVVEDIHDVAVDKDAATPLGLIVNEVVSNSFKHAFIDGRDGIVTVSLKALGDGNATLTVRDNGLGFDPASPVKGIGRRLIQGLTAQLQGETNQVSDNGSVFTLTFPLAKD